ncbi:hypothetical protein HPB50_000825 [Hyalomma asiaticum]|uniref:Uncharacterized protein n=1 Tax=Hyalomma asiaticum TaxID=266040 RepID=A0ACB7RX42_HYAAI|nr:hypothetical protein HPB50_000825 [Hyalomma asiaticum]
MSGYRPRPPSGRALGFRPRGLKAPKLPETRPEHPGENRSSGEAIVQRLGTSLSRETRSQLRSHNISTKQCQATAGHLRHLSSPSARDRLGRDPIAPFSEARTPRTCAALTRPSRRVSAKHLRDRVKPCPQELDTVPLMAVISGRPQLASVGPQGARRTQGNSNPIISAPSTVLENFDDAGGPSENVRLHT